MPTNLHDTVPFLINRIAARISDSVDREFRPLGLNVFGMRVLVLLFLEEARTVGELAQRGALDQSTLSHILRRLHNRGYLLKTRQEHDNRSVLVSLTPKGRELAKKCWKAAQHHDAMLTRGVDATAKRSLKKLLNALYENVPAFKVLGTSAKTRKD